MTNPTPEPPVATPWALEGRWPHAGELQDWLHQHFATRDALTVLGQYIDMAQVGFWCTVRNHRGHIAELRASEATTYEMLQSVRRAHRRSQDQLRDARRQIASLLSQIDARS
jgi:hypothetical protein